MKRLARAGAASFEMRVSYFSNLSISTLVIHSIYTIPGTRRSRYSPSRCKANLLLRGDKVAPLLSELCLSSSLVSSALTVSSYLLQLQTTSPSTSNQEQLPTIMHQDLGMTYCERLSFSPQRVYEKLLVFCISKIHHVRSNHLQCWLGERQLGYSHCYGWGSEIAQWAPMPGTTFPQNWLSICKRNVRRIMSLVSCY